MEEKSKWQKIRNVLINKYVITLCIFACIFLFVGEQSLINQLTRAVEIRQIRHSIQDIQSQTKKAERVLHTLEHPDSLERYARETYKMHEDGEVVFIVE